MNFENLYTYFVLVIFAAPIAVITYYKLFTHKSFLILGIYYLLLFYYTIISRGVVTVPASHIKLMGFISNFADAPLMLLFMTYLATSRTMAKRLWQMFYAFIGFEVIVFLIAGYKMLSLQIVLAATILVMLVVGAIATRHFANLYIRKHSALAKMLMGVAITFSYISYGILYSIFYILQPQMQLDPETNHQVTNSIFVLYSFGVFFGTGTLTASLILERSRIQKIHSLLITRRELAEIYPQTRNTYKPRIPQFDRESLGI